MPDIGDGVKVGARDRIEGRVAREQPSSSSDRVPGYVGDELEIRPPHVAEMNGKCTPPL
jgi:hypothetical protein